MPQNRYFDREVAYAIINEKEIIMNGIGLAQKKRVQADPAEDSLNKCIRFYADDYYMLSNFSPHSIEYGGELYMSSEHAYQAAKFYDRNIARKVREARSSIQAKEIAQHYIGEFQRSNWNNIKISVMEDILKSKADQHRDVKEALLKSGTSEIIEASPTDFFWGLGADGTGRNEVGKIWMRIRDALLAKR